MGLKSVHTKLQLQCIKIEMATCISISMQNKLSPFNPNKCNLHGQITHGGTSR